jgi:ferredoxin
MLLTLGVKNMFGCVVGMQKPQWHFRTGVDRDKFAHLLIEIYRALHPSVTLLDGILAMEGQGPGKRGTPRHLGVLIGGKDALALDQVTAQMLTIDPQSVPVNSVATKMKLIETIEIDGEMIQVPDFASPELVDLMFGPPYLHTFMRKYLTQRPVEDRDLCQMCLECVTHCPVYAINEKNNALHFDYNKCIRCYCCIELCPHGAMKSTQPLAGRLINRFMK